MTLDMGFVIIVGASLSFIGLGVQPPKSDLGSMVAAGARRLPAESRQLYFQRLLL